MSTSRTREKADGELFKSTGIDDNATSTAITIDASENVGIGVTPNAGWSANNKVLDFGYHGSVSTDGDGSKFGMNMAMNAYAVGGADPSSWKYKTNSAFYASLYHQTAGSHNFYVTNNTAATDAAISWTTGFEVLADGKARAKNGLLFGTDTAAANALDDYEEGTWTPTFIGSNGNPTVNYAAQIGKYTKVGNMVTLSLHMNTNSVSGGSSSSNLRISGIPFDSNGAAGGRFGNFQNWDSSLNQSIGCFVNGSYLAVFWKQNIPVYTSQLRTSSDSNQMWFDTTYFTDS